jgi:ubiquinone/menaquinone biosynthesis C-methylase UbiE
LRYQKRLFAWLYHVFISRQAVLDAVDPSMIDRRAALLTAAQGDVLEIGAGDGANLSLYPTDARLVLLDPNPYLLRYIPDHAESGRRRDAPVVQGLGEGLPFSSGRFDVVVSIHVLCSVRDQVAVMAEIYRVLRPGGRFLFLEHVAAPARSPTRILQHLINPAWRLLGDGCYLTRDTASAIAEAGFHSIELQHFRAGYPIFVSPHIVGTARTANADQGPIR